LTIITDPLFYALAVPAVVALGLSKGGFAGMGQMATPLLALVMPPLEAAAIMLPIMIVQDVAAVWVYRKEWDGRVIAIMLPGALAGIGLAWALAAHISEAAVRVFVGAITIAFVLYNWIGIQRVEREIGSANIGAGVFWGTFSGFTTTICQAGGPPYQIYVLALRQSKMVFIGTSAIFFATMNWLKVVPYAALGQFSAKGPRHLAGAHPAGDCHQPARLLAGAAHAAEAVLPGHAGHHVFDLDCFGQDRPRPVAAWLTSASPLA
jgi:hypothetical protein